MYDNMLVWTEGSIALRDVEGTVIKELPGLFAFTTSVRGTSNYIVAVAFPR